MQTKKPFDTMLNPEIFINPAKIDETVNDFIEFVKAQPPIKTKMEINFRKGYLKDQEDYKREYREKAVKLLAWKKWKESNIGSGDIADCFIRVLKEKMGKKKINLVDHRRNIPRFITKLKVPKNSIEMKKVEQALFYIYHSRGDVEECDAYRNAKSELSSNNDVLSFLFYLKDPTRFLPLRPTYFDNAFRYLEINHSMSGKVNWEDYNKYIDIVKIIKEQVLEQRFPKAEITLLDAHSFLWIVNPDDDEPNYFTQWRKRRDTIDWWCDNELNERTNQRINKGEEQESGADKPVSKQQSSIPTPLGKTYKRDDGVSSRALRDAGYACELNVTHPTFKRKNGKNYTEPHHLIHMKYYDDFPFSIDVESNVISLCSNCHNKLHYGAYIIDDLKKLYDDRKERLKNAGIEITFEKLLLYYGITT